MKFGKVQGIASGLLGLGLVVGASGAYAEDLTLNVINKAHAPITSMYVSAAGHNTWEENLFPANSVLPVGNKIAVHIKDNLTSCEYDIKATFKTGETSEDFDVDLCKLDKGSYTYTK